ncbi:MAG TPA: EAL domain-containing protein [Methylomirabilota bacterium]|nr:EAL domain-containing protein [Methylomirabilota bacterium]
MIPSIELTVLVLAGGLVLATALAVSANASSHLEDAATAEAVSAVEAVVHAYVDPLLSDGLLGTPDAATASEVNHQLELLTGSGSILRIKVWSTDGTVLFSDLPALRGRSFPIKADLAEALEGNVEADLTAPVSDENVFEKGIASKLLEVYLPIDAGGAEPVGAYEIYQDATTLQADIASTRRDVFLIVVGIGLVLLIGLYLAFHGADRLMAELTGRLRRSETRFRSMVQNSSDLIILADRDAQMLFVSPAVERILGGTAAGRMNQPVTDLVHTDDVEWITALLERLAATPGSVSGGEVRMRHADGRWRWVELVGTNLLQDADIRGIVLNCRDVTERRTLEEQLRHQAFHDPLTNLANRPLLVDRIEHELQARPMEMAATTAVLLMDLDDFKTINDSLGHAAGDELLAVVAERLRGALRGRDTAARIGGDEFGILVTTPDREEVETIAERIRAAVSEPMDIGDHHLTVAASLGIAFANGPGTTADELLRSADVAMYTAKARGKGRCVVFETSMHDAAVRRLRLKADLEQGLEAGQFHLLYQPIIDLASGAPVGMEALLRWDHPGWTLGPAEFIPFAEETGMIIPLGHWVLEEACRHAVALDRTPAGRGLDVSVNVSGLQVARPGFSDEVAAVLASTGLAPERLILELTESVLVDRDGIAVESLGKLRALGVRLAIDDFGTGYSSLSYLRELPIDILKIDLSFVAALDTGREAPAVVRSIIRLAGTLGLHTIAEGIERPEQAGRLRTLGADYGQGFHYAPPLSEAELAEFLRAHASQNARADAASA